MVNAEAFERRRALLQASNWRGALTILSQRRFRGLAWVWDHIDLDERTIHVADLVRAVFSTRPEWQPLLLIAVALYQHFHFPYGVDAWHTMKGKDARLVADAVWNYLADDERLMRRRHLRKILDCLQSAPLCAPRPGGVSHESD